MTDAAIRLVRRLATARGFRRLTRVQALLRVSFALRAALVRERLRFAANELRPRATTRVYHLRRSGVAIAVRHHTPDVLVLDEIFSQREYEPPPEAEAALATLPAAPRIVDLGANIGLFGAWALERFPDAAILAVEADPANAEIHRAAIEANAAGERWRLVEAFASTAAGSRRFVGGAHTTSHEGDEGVEVPAIDVFPELARADLIKIDIEGAEWPLLLDERFASLRPRIVVLEYHRTGCPAGDPEAAAAGALRSASLRPVPAGRKQAFGAGLLWGIPSAPSAGERDAPRRA